MPLAAAPLAFGKIPAQGDFVRLGVPSPALDALDGWLQEGVAAARQHPPAPAVTYHFVYAPPEAPHVLAGALRMSADRVGRRYPFLAAYAVDRWQVDVRDAYGWPLAWRGALAAAAHLVCAAADGLDLRDIEARLYTLPGLPDPRDRDARQAHEAACYQTPMSAFWEALGLDAASRDAAFATLVGALADARAPSPSARGLVYPLPVETAPVDPVAVWVEAEWRLRGRRTSGPALFWAAPGMGAALLSFAHGPRGGALAALAGAPASGPALVRLADPALPQPPPLPLREQRLVAYEALSVAQFLRAL